MTYILVADKAASTRARAKRTLDSLGLFTVACGTAFEALAFVASCQPSLIFLDEDLPGLSGYETCALMRSNLGLRSVPVVMLTRGRDDRQALARQAGASTFLSKPFNEGALSALVLLMLEQHCPDWTAFMTLAQRAAPAHALSANASPAN